MAMCGELGPKTGQWSTRLADAHSPRVISSSTLAEIYLLHMRQLAHAICPCICAGATQTTNIIQLIETYSTPFLQGPELKLSLFVAQTSHMLRELEGTEHRKHGKPP
jgi:hypothetical protein